MKIITIFALLSSLALVSNCESDHHHDHHHHDRDEGSSTTTTTTEETTTQAPSVGTVETRTTRSY